MRYFFSFAAICFLLASLFATPSCKPRDEGFEQALVIATDDITPTGCGYLLRFSNNNLMKPEYVPSAYQHDSLPVLVKYTNTGRESNCMPQNPIDIITIDDIRRE